MHKRTFSLLALLLTAACADAPTAPEAASGGSAPASALSAVSDARMADLSIALADARSRLLPAIGDQQGTLMAVMQRLDERLAAEDAAGVMDATADVETALAALPAGQMEALLAELDALRLALGEVRATTLEAAGPATVQEQ